MTDSPMAKAIYCPATGEPLEEREPYNEAERVSCNYQLMTIGCTPDFFPCVDERNDLFGGHGCTCHKFGTGVVSELASAGLLVEEESVG